MPPYHYSKLESSRRVDRVRLLKRIPRKHVPPADAARTQSQLYDIIEVNLNEAPKYETVSYVWGSARRIEHLPLVNDRYILITETLREALQYVSKASRYGCLWIDQVCINQDDIDERNEQVLLMRDIYIQAKSCFIWLGTGDQNTQDLKSWSRQNEISEHSKYQSSSTDYLLPDGEPVAATPQLEPDSAPTASNSRRWFKRMEVSERPKYQFSNMESLLPDRERAVPTPGLGSDCGWTAIFTRPWFKRAWVFQEAALSRRLLFVAGADQFSWNALDNMLWNTIWADRATASKVSDSLSQPVLQGMHSFMNICNTRRSSRIYGIFAWDFASTLASIAGIYEAQDPRDLVYAFVGIMIGGFRALKLLHPDYRLPVARVFADTTKAIIVAHDDLSIFQMFWYDTETMIDNVKMPSWVLVPTRSVTGGSAMERIRHHVTNDFRTSHNALQDLGRPLELVLTGRRIATVKYLTKFIRKKDSTRKVRTLQEAYHVDEIWTEFTNVMQTPGVHNEDILSKHRQDGADLQPPIARKDLFRLLFTKNVNDHIAEDTLTRLMERYESSMRSEETLADCVRIVPCSDSREEEVDDLLHPGSTDGPSRTPFITTMHRLGLGPYTILSGDLVCALNGSPVPVILRRCGTDRYIYVGTCYLEHANITLDDASEDFQTFVLV